MKKKDRTYRLFLEDIMRNKISHEYFGIDYEILWDVASNYLPENKEQIKEILEKEI